MSTSKAHTLTPRELEATQNPSYWTVWVAGVKRQCATLEAATDLAKLATENTGCKSLVYCVGLIGGLEVDALLGSYSAHEGYNWATNYPTVQAAA